jgi:nucleoside-diphosphate-sugar epimerase
MRVFVAGATGVVGKRAVTLLVRAGHEVSAAARTAEKAAELHGAGARPVTVDLFDAASVGVAVAGHDAVCNLTTHIPPMSRAALPGAWTENTRIRREVSRNLVDAAMRAGAGRFVQESVSFLYADHGDHWITEEEPLDLPAFARAVEDAEAAVGRFAAAGGAGVALRFGLFYGPDGHMTAGTIALVRRGLAPFVGPRRYVSSIATDDAASAVAAALELPAGAYNVVDDDPVTHAEYVASLAGALGIRPPRVLPGGFAVALGRAGPLSRSQRVANRRLRDASGWTPRWPSVREGWPGVLGSRPVISG